MAADNVCVSGLYMSRQKNAFCTELALAHILQANAPTNFHAFRASNAHPVQSLYMSRIPWLWRCNVFGRN